MDSRRRLGRGLTAEELERVLRHLPWGHATIWESVNEQSDLPTSMGAPATRALATVGVTRLADLVRFRRAELLALHGMGPKAIGIIEAAMRERGITLRP